MSLLVVNYKKLLTTGFYILNFRQINPNKSDDTKLGLFSENIFNLLLEFLKIYKKVSLLQVPIWFDFGKYFFEKHDSLTL